MSERNEVLNLGEEVSVYCIQSYFKGRPIRQDSELDELTEKFLDHLAKSMIHPGWDYEKDELLKHVCTSNCTLETFIVMGRPYTENVEEAIKWLVRHFQSKIILKKLTL